MSRDEELSHIEKHNIYLRKIIEVNNERIAELSVKVDPYQIYRDALANGKRVARKRYDNHIWEIWETCNNPEWVEWCSYKIVEDDEVIEITISCLFGEKFKPVKFTKCALTGKITAEVIE